MDEKKKKEVRDAIAEKLRTYLDGNFGKLLRDAGVGETVISEELDNIASGTACVALCNATFPAGSQELKDCIKACDDE